MPFVRIFYVLLMFNMFTQKALLLKITGNIETIQLQEALS